jgi:hypothetical protein
MIHFASFASGTVAATRSLGNYADALHAEIAAWRAGDRNPQQISNNWTRRLHAPQVARSVIELAERAAHP